MKVMMVTVVVQGLLHDSCDVVIAAVVSNKNQQLQHLHHHRAVDVLLLWL
jgi:hypothetical protein